MAITLDDAEAFANRELRRVCLDGHDAPPWRIGLQRLGVRLMFFGNDSPMRCAGQVGRHGVLNDRPLVYVWDGMIERDQALTAWHEYMHHVIVAERLELECHAERFCTRFAAAMVAPADSMRRAWRQSGGDLIKLAELRPAASASVLTLRVGDLEIAPVALFDRRGARHVVPSQPVPRGLGKLVDLARREGRAESALGRAWRLPDDTSRVGVLLAA